MMDLKRAKQPLTKALLMLDSIYSSQTVDRRKRTVKTVKNQSLSSVEKQYKVASIAFSVNNTTTR
ncbi:hypothetical protein PS2_104 [Serratia phage PS2]|uniref:Uncharacterized protein n=1 Tax=Serratia phage PS2 TaxID=1481112 RepID=A0A023W518_9CAUD|nr:hypothetical protein FF83_gp104 [Serratia phage PS2]AHY25350.1 hypothetical protein PS2_104 [Serratia phage PS2]